MAIAQIENWLNSGKDYDLGVEIYNQLGTSFLLKKEFQKGKDSYNIKKLEIELVSLNNNSNTSSEEKVELPVQYFKTIAAPEPYHNQLLELRNNRKSKYKQVNHLHASLSHAKNDQQRKEIAFEILNIWDDINESWAVEDKFIETGTFTPAAKNELPDSPVTLSKMLSNARSNITKATKKLKAAEKFPNNEKEILEKKIHLQNHIDLKLKIEEKLNSYE